MPLEEREMKEALKFAIKGLILQEVRVLQLKQAHCPSFILDEMARSIQEAKREIMGQVRFTHAKEKDILIKRLIIQSVNEEIDRAIQMRKNRCLRCIHMRFYDEERTAHLGLPVRASRAQIIGCDQFRPASEARCRHFTETTRAISLDDYLDEMALFYELREMFHRFEEIWKDYLTK